MRIRFCGLLLGGVTLVAFSSAGAQAQQGAPAAQTPALDAATSAALADLSARYATEIERIEGWYRGRPVAYYNLGAVPQPVSPARVIWPIHGFDAHGNPVAMRGQQPIFSTIPGLTGYSGIWKLEYLVVADRVQPNVVRTVEDADRLVSNRTAYVRAADLTLNLPIVARGTRLAGDTRQASTGWFAGHEVQFFDFGVVGADPVPMWRFARKADVDGAPALLEGQNSIVDSIPVAPAYPDLWAIRFVRVDSTYQPNSISAAFALQRANLQTDSVSAVLNLPITEVEGSRLRREPSPLTTFADQRSPFPPSPTRTPSTGTLNAPPSTMPPGPPSPAPSAKPGSSR